MIGSSCSTTQVRSSNELRLRTRKDVGGLAIDISKTDDCIPVRTLDKTQQPKGCFETLKAVDDNLSAYQGFRRRYGEHFPSIIDQPCSLGEQEISDSLEKSMTNSFVYDSMKIYGFDRGILIVIQRNFKLADSKVKTFERICMILAIVSFVTHLYAATQIKYHGYIEKPTSLPTVHYFKAFIAKISDACNSAALELELANLTKNEILKCIQAVRDETNFPSDLCNCENVLERMRYVCDKLERVLRAELDRSFSTEAANTPSGEAGYTQIVFEIILNPKKSLNDYKEFSSGGIDKELQLNQRNEWYMIWKFMALQADHEGRENHFTIICRLMSVIASAFKSRDRRFNSCEF